MSAMRLYLINPRNPLVSIVNVKESRWNRFRVWKPLSLVGGLSYRNNLRVESKAYADFIRCQAHRHHCVIPS